MGLSAAHAQQRTRDILFPDYVKDQSRLKSLAKTLEAKPAEAMITSSKALRDRIFRTYGSGTAAAAAPVVNKETRQFSSSKSFADAVKEMKDEQAATQAKAVAPKLEQQETEQKPKN